MKILLISKIRLILILFVFAGIAFLYSDDDKDDIHTVKIIIPKVALLDIESGDAKDITLKMVAPEEAGNPLLGATDDRIWLNVTSVVETGNTRSITVKIDEPQDGIDLKVISDTYSGSGYGSWGTPQPLIILNTTDQNLVTGIKSGESGDGIHSGFNIKYIAEANNSEYGKITSNTNKDIIVIYTLTQ